MRYEQKSYDLRSEILTGTWRNYVLWMKYEHGHDSIMIYEVQHGQEHY